MVLTRAKCWVRVFGVGEYPLYDELNKCIKARGRFEFIYRRPQQDINYLGIEEVVYLQLDIFLSTRGI